MKGAQTYFSLFPSKINTGVRQEFRMADMLLQGEMVSTELSRWVNRLRERRGTNKAAMALANKLARMGWALLRNETVYCPA